MMDKDFWKIAARVAGIEESSLNCGGAATPEEAYAEAADTVAKCPKDRLRAVLLLLARSGLDVDKVQALAKEKRGTSL